MLAISGCIRLHSQMQFLTTEVSCARNHRQKSGPRASYLSDGRRSLHRRRTAARPQSGKCRQAGRFVGAREEMNEDFKALFNGGVVGPTMLETIFDGGRRKATSEGALANYDATVAN